MELYLFSLRSLYTLLQRQMAVSGGLVMEAEEMEVAVDSFTITRWAFDVFEWPCEYDG